MTVARCTESSQRSKSSARELPLNSEHDALKETATMSSYGPQEFPSIASSSIRHPPNPSDVLPTKATRNAQTQTTEEPSVPLPQSPRFYPVQLGKLEKKDDKSTAQRVQFGDFAEQLRQQQYLESRKHLLQQRKRVLQRTITLSARLHRVSSWIGDGLVEISEQSDTAGFVRVHQHMQNLIDLSYSQWDRELHALDPLGKLNIPNAETAGSPDVLSKLTSSAQADLIDLLSCLRSNPRFLVERFKVLAPSQIVSLWNPPRFHKLPDAAESEYRSFSHGRNKYSQQRVRAFSKSLEEYASSFERSNPLSFLLFNMYGTNQSSIDAENQLRLSTWSTVCAELKLTSGRAYHALVMQLLDCFASLYEWQARDSVEMFLMDVLQRGAFLLNQSSDISNTRRYPRSDPLATPQAQEFFNNAVYDLFAILVKYEGGFPAGALQFASAVLGKLPTVEQQTNFRGTFFSNWFIDHFLMLTIIYPENENMLLRFHVSNNAREKLLRQLWLTVRDRVHDVYDEQRRNFVDDYFRVCVETMVGTIDLIESVNPYSKTNQHSEGMEKYTQASVTISVSEIVQALEALSPQAMHAAGSDDQFLISSTSAFYEQYARASGQFDRLKGSLIQLLEPGSSATDVHPGQEHWLQIEIDAIGRPSLTANPPSEATHLDSIEREDLDGAQRGAIRLFKDRVSDSTMPGGTSYRSDLLKSRSLETLFREMSIYTSARLDPIGCTYWNRANDTLHKKYPLSILINDDSAVLQTMFKTSKVAQSRCRECCTRLETQLSVMEDICLKIRSTINKCIERFDRLRMKVWYSVDVVLSKHYDDAKNIARALNNMAISTVHNIRPNNMSSFAGSRPMSPRSTTSSMFELPYEDTMNMMKASIVHGGPKKLADKQIELTKNWLEQTHIENFCRGEERIHRFCMEVYTVSRSLVGETLSESPVLWASELFGRERSLYDIRSFNVTSAPASTRPASVVSDTMSMSHRSWRPVLRSAESLRMALLEDRRASGNNRISPDCLPPELASSIGSLSRAHSATTAESISSVFSPLPSNARSLTSASVYSRSASIFDDAGLSRFTDAARGKSKFLEKVHQDLICLLLSDLGCPVWSLGSETDAMLQTSQETPAVSKRLKQRMIIEALADCSRSRSNHRTKQEHRPRSQSVSIESGLRANTPISDDVERSSDQQQDISENTNDDHLEDLATLLRKMSQQNDPLEKLAVAAEFHQLSLSTLKAGSPFSDLNEISHRSIYDKPRRSSLNDYALQSQPESQRDELRYKLWNEVGSSVSTEHDIVQHLMSDLIRLGPRTLFRDLQYISAFVPTHCTDNTPRGTALLQIGLAALAYKDEVCRSMVDVAHILFQQTKGTRSRQQVMPRITELWMSAAREGNAVAQRELASLYLSHPELLPVMSVPLSIPSEVFKNDMLWHKRDSRNASTQALCLALHWMQEASTNGDQLANQKLEERRERISIP